LSQQHRKTIRAQKKQNTVSGSFLNLIGNDFKNRKTKISANMKTGNLRSTCSVEGHNLVFILSCLLV